MRQVTIPFALIAGLAHPAAGQEEASAPRTELERHLLALDDAEQRSAAMHALWRQGPPAVPMLAAAVTRGGDAAAAAQLVLRQLGGEAAPAAPVLRRAMAKADERMRGELARTLAYVEGEPCILASRHDGNEIVQVDFEGRIVRRVACQSPWGVWPLPGDRVGAVSFNNGAIEEFGWDGVANEGREVTKIVGCLTSMLPLADGGRITTHWDGDGVLARRGEDGAVRWSKQNDAFRSVRFLDTILATTRKPPQLVCVGLDGEERWKIALPTPCSGVFPLPNGNFLMNAQSGQVLEVTQKGDVVADFRVDGPANDAARLRDGRTIVSAKSGVYLFAADGGQKWHLDNLGQCGPMFVRAPW